MRSATVYLTLRETCPECRERLGERGVAVRRPEGKEVARLRVGHAAKLDRRRGLHRDALGPGKGSADVVDAQGDLRRDDEPRCRAPRRETREVYDGLGHEAPGRDDDLAAVHRPELGGPEGDLFDAAGVARDFDLVAEGERPLEEHTMSREAGHGEVLQRVSD